MEHKAEAEKAVFALLTKKRMTLAAAESCTGGLVAERMTDLPGASKVFMGGVVSYTDQVKAKVLGVPRALLEEFGAVSEPVARRAYADGGGYRRFRHRRCRSRDGRARQSRRHGVYRACGEGRHGLPALPVRRAVPRVYPHSRGGRRVRHGPAVSGRLMPCRTPPAQERA